MEIRVKTAEEFHDSHVTIEIRAEGADIWAYVEKLKTALTLTDTSLNFNRGRVVELERTVGNLKARLNTVSGELDTCRGHLDLRDGELVSANEQRDEARNRVAELERTVDNLTARPAAQVEKELRDRIAALEGNLFRTEETLMSTRRQREDTLTGLERRTQERDERERARALVEQTLSKKISELEHSNKARLNMIRRVGTKLRAIRKIVENRPSTPETLEIREILDRSSDHPIGDPAE